MNDLQTGTEWPGRSDGEIMELYVNRNEQAIAERTGRSVPGVKKALAKIRKELKERLTRAGVSL